MFEINRNFRNEGLSTRHNPEFTMLEFYWAYADYHDLMDLTEQMLRGAAESVLGSAQFTSRGVDYDFGKPFERMTVLEAIVKYMPEVSLEQLNDMNTATEIAEQVGVSVKPSWGLGKVQIEIFETVAEHRLIQPTFITAYPAEVSPLARRHDDNPFVTDRFEFLPVVVSWRMVSRSLTMLKIRLNVFASKLNRKKRAMMKPCSTTKIMSPHWNTVCRQQPVRALVLTVW